MRALLLGSGGREHALATGLSRSRVITELVAAPGNPGIAELGETVLVDPLKAGEVTALARRLEADLVVIGPEAPLVAGVADALRADGRRVFGPGAAAARIEGSKAYAKQLMDRAGIPTARWRAFETLEEAVAFLDEMTPPYVIKADGLAAGKGVTVTPDRDEAVEALRERLSGEKFGDAGRRVVIEEYLAGEEVSLIGYSDGEIVRACEPAQDYKRVFDGDGGPNTGGMGCYSPVPLCPPELAEQLANGVLQPMVHATAGEGAPFVGALYAGLALASGGPKVLEFNVRFGDPETQALIPRLRSDLGELCLASVHGSLESVELEWSPEVCVVVVLASWGYPGPYQTGFRIEGLEEALAVPGVEIFHAGTAREGDGVVTAGGRVLAVSALGVSFEQARANAYAAVDCVFFEGKHCRLDIALKAQAMEQEVG